MLQDSDNLRGLIIRLLPGIEITGVAKPSGQRVVYYCRTSNKSESNEQWLGYGNVVLKVSEGLSAQGIAYIQKEIEILNSLDSPYYPQLLFNDVFSEDPDTEEIFENRFHITIEEFIESIPLSDCKEKYNDEKSVVGLLIRLLEAFRLLWDHKLKIVHRDIKPENILIRDDGSVVVIDLGIVREEGSAGVTNTGNMFGPCTLQYASPEQATNDKKNISFKSDLFALGTLSYELLTGNNPYVSQQDIPWTEILENVINLKPESLYSKDVCSEEFSNIISKLMEKEPYKRYRTIEHLHSDLLAHKEKINVD